MDFYAASNAECLWNKRLQPNHCTAVMLAIVESVLCRFSLFFFFGPGLWTLYTSGKYTWQWDIAVIIIGRLHILQSSLFGHSTIIYQCSPGPMFFDNLLDATARQCGLSKCGPPSSIGGEEKDKNRVLTATVAQYITQFFVYSFIHSLLWWTLSQWEKTDGLNCCF